MKKINKYKITSVLVVLGIIFGLSTFSIPASAEGTTVYTSGDWQYTINDDGVSCTITKYNSREKYRDCGSRRNR